MPTTTKTPPRKKPAAKATAAGAEADAMHAEAMAAPLGLPLSTDALAALERESPGGPMTIIAAVRKSYDACKTITKGDCEALLEQWHGEAREAVFGPLAAWLGAPPLPAPLVVMSGGNARAALALPEAPADPFDEIFAPKAGTAEWSAERFLALHDSEPIEMDPVLEPDDDAPRTVTLPAADALTTTIEAVGGAE